MNIDISEIDNYCMICNHETKKIFNTDVLNKYKVDYFQCPSCDFIQTEKPYWLDEAYSEAITKLDIGIIYRNIHFSNKITHFFNNNLFSSDGIYLDYGGGYGIFVRMMRDKGFNFYRQDIFCNNLFAKHFDISDLSNDAKFNLLTAFEVFEHLENPLDEIQNMLLLADTIIFSTLLLPFHNVNPQNWWYFIPETGQHLSLFSLKSLKYLSKKFNLHLYSNEKDLHIFSKNKLNYNPFEKANKSFFTRIKHKLFNSDKFKLLNSKKYINPTSLLSSDFDFVKNKLNNEIIT